MPPDSMWIRSEAGDLRAALWLETIEAGEESGREDLVIHRWEGLLLIGSSGAGPAGTPDD